MTFQLDKGGAEGFSMFNWGAGGVGIIFAGKLYPLCLPWYMIDMYSKYFLFPSTSYEKETFDLNNPGQ